MEKTKLNTTKYKQDIVTTLEFCKNVTFDSYDVSNELG